MKKLIALLLAMVMVIGLLAGCGKKSSSNGSGDNKKDNASQAEDGGNKDGDSATSKMIYQKGTAYDKDGNIEQTVDVSCDAATRTITITIKDGEGTPMGTMAMEFDADGNSIRYANNAAGQEGNEVKYEYTDGKLTKETYYNNNKVTSEYKYTYDASGAMTNKTHYDEDGEKTWEEIYTCENGKQISMVTKGGKSTGDSDDKTLFEYDANGNKIKETRLYADGTKYQEDQWTYDANGNMLTEIYYDADGNKTAERRFQYDANKLIYEAHYSYDELQRITEYQYDANGNCLTTITYNGERAVISKIVFENYVTIPFAVKEDLM